MAIETLMGLAAAAGHDIHAQTYSLSQAKRGSEFYEVLTGGYTGAAGPPVTEHTAMMVSAWYAGLGLIAGSVAQIPCHVFERSEDGYPIRSEHPYGWLLRESPNARMSAAVMWEYLVVSLLAHGDAFAELKINRRGEVSEINPLHPANVQVETRGAVLDYHVMDDGGAARRRVEYDRMIHVPGLGFNGERGMSVLRYAARESLSIALAAQEYSARYFSNGARPDLALKTPDWLTTEQASMLLDSWSQSHQGPRQSHRPAILQGGLDIRELGNTAEAAQLLGARAFQVEDIARILGIPAFMIGLTEKTTSWGSGVDAMGINYVKYTLNRHLVKIAQECNRKLFPGSWKFFCEFVTAALERGDVKSRNEAYRSALGGSAGPGYMTPNEVRRRENLAPSPNPAADQLVDWRQNAESPESAPATETGSAA